MPRRLSCVLAALAAMGASAYAQPADNAICADANAKPEARVKSCSALLKASGGSEAERNKLLSLRGVAYYESGEYKRAIADHSEIIRKNPKDAIAYDNRGNAYRRNAEYDKAIADYDAAIKLDSKFVHAYVARGDAYSSKGDLDRAIADCNKAIGIDPKFANSYGIRGVAYMAKRETDKAIADFNEAVKLNPKYTYALYNRGSAREIKGDIDGAMADYNETIRVDPETVEGHQSRGILRLYGGAQADAIADLKRAAELSPDDSSAALWRDLALRRNGQKGSLRMARSKLDMQSWPAPVVRMMLNEITPARAMQLAKNKDATVAQNQSCEVIFFSAELAGLKGQKDKAREGYRAAREQCPPDFYERSGAIAALRALGEK